MRKTKNATVLVYSIILTSIALILAIVAMNNHISLILNAENLEIEKNFYNNIKSNINIFSEKLKEINNDGGGFTDNISCPGSSTGSTLITMSGTTKKENLKSVLFNDNGTIICLSDYNNKNLEIYFNENYDGFSSAKYDTFNINFGTGPDLIGTFPDSDSTKITIMENSYNKPDLFDDNFNNDNYQSKTTD